MRNANKNYVRTGLLESVPLVGYKRLYMCNCKYIIVIYIYMIIEILERKDGENRCESYDENLQGYIHKSEEESRITQQCA